MQNSGRAMEEKGNLSRSAWKSMVTYLFYIFFHCITEFHTFFFLALRFYPFLPVYGRVALFRHGKLSDVKHKGGALHLAKVVVHC